MGITFIDFFSGIGGFRNGMERVGHKCIGFCECDKYALASYTSMHLITDSQREYLKTLTLKKRQEEILKDEYRNGEWYANDIKQIESRDIPYADCWCAGFPCQDISNAGKQLGFDGSRSSLYFELIRLLKGKEEKDKPEWIFLENVKNLLSINNGWDFARVLFALDEIGYDAEWELLNSKYFGVPQNRERVYIIGHLRSRSERKVFPVSRSNEKDSDAIKEDTTLNSCGAGILRNVRTEYGKQIRKDYEAGKLNISRHKFLAKEVREDGISNTLSTVDKDNYVAVKVEGFNCMPDGACRTLKNQYQKNSGINFMLGTSRGATGAVLKIREATKKGYAEAKEGDAINFSVPGSNTRRGRVGNGIANTLDTGCNQGIMVKVSEELSVYAIWYEKYNCYIAIRKLTPKECYRLQGWSDDYFEKAQFVNSDNQLYRQAGNGVTVNVIEEIAKRF